MATETFPLFLKFLNVFWEQVKISIHRLSECVNKACSLQINDCATSGESSKEVAGEEPITPIPSRRHTQWVLAEKTGTDKKSNVMMVEVEYFNDAHIADLHGPSAYNINNYTIDGEDPNLRITHYPPSNRVH